LIGTRALSHAFLTFCFSLTLTGCYGQSVVSKKILKKSIDSVARFLVAMALHTKTTSRANEKRGGQGFSLT